MLGLAVAICQKQDFPIRGVASGAHLKIAKIENPLDRWQVANDQSDISLEVSAVPKSSVAINTPNFADVVRVAFRRLRVGTRHAEVPATPFKNKTERAPEMSEIKKDV